MDPSRLPSSESIGKRIARLRSECGLTQQALAARLGVSRVAISHIEMDLTIPSERTITLLAGIFKSEPVELAAGTTYPQAKAEKLPLTVCCFTRLEFNLALLGSDLDWLQRLRGCPDWSIYAEAVQARWRDYLTRTPLEDLDAGDREMVRFSLKQIDEICGN